MSRKTAKKNKKTGKKAAGKVRDDAFLSEILGILVITLALLSAVGLFWGREATTLSAVRQAYISLFGITSIAVPVIIGLLGLWILLKKRTFLWTMLQVFLITLFTGAFLNIVRIDPGHDFIISHRAWLSAGGTVTSWFIVPLMRALTPVGAMLILIAVVMVYTQLVFGVSYIEIGKKIAPHILQALNAIGLLISKAFNFFAERASEMAQKRRERIEALKEQKAREVEERAQRLKEEEARVMSGGSFLDDDEEQDDDISLTNDDDKNSVSFEIQKNPEEELVAEEDYVETQRQKEIAVQTIGEEGDDVERITWKLPAPHDWLDPPADVSESSMDGTMRDKLEEMLQSFKVPAKITNVVKGASFTRFEIELEPGTKVSRIVQLEANIALSLATDIKTIRIEAPIPGKSAIGIEVPNVERAMVPFRKLFLNKKFVTLKNPLSFVLGEDITGKAVFAAVPRMPHMLVAGSTGSGKSVCLNAILCSILAREFPTQTRMILVDMKRVELTPFDGIPHLMTNVIQEPQEAANALKWVCDEMTRRFKIFAEVGVRNIESYNNYVENEEEKMYRILFVIDELADLMMISNSSMNIENYICRVTQLARAVGIHMILATQRPDTKIITGTIKNNIPARLSFSVRSQIDSRTIIDQKGAETLLGKGDMLYLGFGSNKLQRLQGPFVSDSEVRRLVKFWKSQGEVEYQLKFDDGTTDVSEGMTMGENLTEDEKLYFQAVELVVNTGQASISKIQRHLRIGYNRAARMVDLMEERGVVGPADGSRPREVLQRSVHAESGVD